MNVAITFDKEMMKRMPGQCYDAIVRAKLRALSDIGQAVASRATMAFRTPKLRPSPWAPRKPSYIVTVNKKTKKKTRKLDDHPLLIKSGVLRQSINWKLEDGDTVVIGTDKKYAGYHQLGTKKMPARPFMPVDAKGDLTPDMVRKINKLVANDVQEELAKIGV